MRWLGESDINIKFDNFKTKVQDEVGQPQVTMFQKNTQYWLFFKKNTQILDRND